MNLLDQIKAAVLRALGRTAKKGAENQAAGMVLEAQSIIASAKIWRAPTPQDSLL